MKHRYNLRVIRVSSAPYRRDIREHQRVSVQIIGDIGGIGEISVIRLSVIHQRFIREHTVKREINYARK